MALTKASDTYKDFNDLKHHTTQTKTGKLAQACENDNILITATMVVD